jgi:hypothetical protein
MRRLSYIPVLLGVVIFAAAGAHAALSSHTAVSSTMHAFVHEDETIGLQFDDGSDVGNQARNAPVIPPGTYTIRAVDDAGAHNFHLTGPGVDIGTGIGAMGTPTWTVTFASGAHYRFQCDDHPDFMYGEFNTSGTGGATGGSSSGGSSSGGSTSGGSSSGGSTSGGSSSSGAGSVSNSGSTAVAGTLAGRVNPAGKLVLTYRGVPVTKVKAGRYKITVADKAPTRSFVVAKTGGAKTTVSGVAFVGTKTVTLNLSAGKWTFYTSAGAKSTSSFTVS